MTAQDLASLITPIAAAIGAVAAALWGHGLTTAKDATIKAKDAQIEALRAVQDQMVKAKDAQIETLRREIDFLHKLTPKEILPHLSSTKELLESIIGSLKQQLYEAQKAID